jgi:phosphofructokinase-like protein
LAERKRIGILTSGGDCAGLNAVIRAVAFRAIDGYGWEVVGIRDSTHGLMKRPVDAVPLTLDIFDGTILRQGGTMLGTVNWGDPFAFPMPDGTAKDRSAEIVEGFRLLGLDALIAVGGDGSLSILRRIAQAGGIDLVGIPKTIDNDVGVTENAIGYLTAVDVATEALDRLQPTAASHDRVMILEVMGRGAGHIALSAGIAGGADAILLPEIPWTAEGLAAKIRRIAAGGRHFGLVIVAEAAALPGGHTIGRKTQTGGVRFGGVGEHVAEIIERETGAETRVTVLGHLQRGGPPNSRDRLFASVFGVHAVDLVAAGRFDRMVAWSARRVIDVPLADAIRAPQCVDPEGSLAATARGLGIYIGEPSGAPQPPA